MSTPPEKKKPTLLHITRGATVSHQGRDYQVLRVVDLNMVLAREPSSGEKVLLKIGTLEAPAQLEDPRLGASARDLEDVSEDEWAIAESKLALIEPLSNSRDVRTREDYKKAAEAAGVSTATIYRWVSDYRVSGTLTSLLPVRRGGGRGKSRLSKEVLLIIEDYFKTKYLSLQKPSASAAAREIRRLCSNAQLSPLPAASTIYRHLGWISDEEKLKRREGSKAAREKFAIHRNPIPDADWPLAITQMDHTLLPIMIVDDEHRKPIGRPWITLLIDVYSRVCLGMYLSMDDPSAMSAGMCVAHAILPKDAWMARLGLSDIEWPFWGVMDVLHMDNAREFRGNMLRVAAKEYNFDLHLRPVKVPHYGAHIERLMGTVSQGLKEMEGAAFSGPTERGEYDSEGRACMTFDKLEKWLVLFFARYHRDIHTGIGTTPLAKWREGILGTRKTPGRGLPPRRTDEEKLRIDFMPFIERTVQDYGVVFDKLHYFHDVLRPWVSAPDPDHPKHKRLFRFRYDPRDISVLYFFDPSLGRYYPIPYRNTSLPPVSIWEFRAAKKKADELGLPDYDERVVFDIINRQRAIEDEEAAKTKSARVARQKRVQHEKARKVKKVEMPTASRPAPSAPPQVVPGYNPDEIEPVDDE